MKPEYKNGRWVVHYYSNVYELNIAHQFLTWAQALEWIINHE